MDPPGFKRNSVHGKRICYRTIPDLSKEGHAHRTLYSIKEVKDYLLRIGYKGDALLEALSKFDFTVKEGDPSRSKEKRESQSEGEGSRNRRVNI